MKIYYAHCMALYDTAQERRDVATLETLFSEVVNPNSEVISMDCARVRREFDEGTLVYPKFPGATFQDAGAAVLLLVFYPLVLAADCVAFRALPDGSIPAGVAQEIQWAAEMYKPVIELPCGFTRRVMTVEQTREYLREVGNR